MSRLGAALALVVAVALTACGEQTLDVAEVESTIGQRLTRNAKQKVTVRCPEEVKIKKGDSFDCTASGKRGRTTVTVTQLDDNGRVRGVVKGP
jgi:Domain of unknown function (DUF4333)